MLTGIGNAKIFSPTDMTVFSCCGISRDRNSRKSSECDLSDSSAVTESLQFQSKLGLVDEFGSSVEVHMGSPTFAFSRAQSSRLSEASARSSRHVGNIARERYRRTSTGRHSTSSIGHSSDAFDIDEINHEMTRLRRALELTQRELIRTETELTYALVSLAREREENRKRDRNSHLFYSIFHHGGHHGRVKSISPSKRISSNRSGQPTLGRRRSGSCPHALAGLPPPSVLSDKFQTIKHLIGNSSPR